MPKIKRKSDDFSIIVRSHKRSHLILDMTLNVLLQQKDLDLERCLWLNINHNEVEEYEEVLKDFPYAGIIICYKKGGHNSINTTVDNFEPGDKITFMDDDTYKMWEWHESPNKPKVKRDLTCLGKYLTDAFETLDRGYAKAFHFYCMPNPYWKKGRGFKEVRPHHFGGDFWGGYADAAMMKVDQAHDDDRLRGANYAHRDGGVLIYNWIGQKGAVLLEGGMQAGDRGTSTDRLEKTKELCYNLWDNEPMYKMYHKEPYLHQKRQEYTVRMKSITQIRQFNPKTKHIKWSGYFQEKPDDQARVRSHG